MNSSNHNQDQIDRYLTGSLEAEELKKFRESLNTDPVLAEEVKQQEILVGGINVHGKRELRKKFELIRKDVLNEQPVIGLKKPNYLKRAISIAVIVLVLLAPVIYFSTLTDLTSDELYAENYTALQISANRDSKQQDALARADQLYINGNYEQAYKIYFELLTLHPKDYGTMLYAGICQMELRNHDKALANFQTIIERNHPFFTDHARWYSALAHLNKNEIPECKNILKQLSKDASADHHAEATNLLKIVEKL